MSDLSGTCGEGLHDDIFIGEVNMKLEAALLVSIHTAALFELHRNAPALSRYVSRRLTGHWHDRLYSYELLYVNQRTRWAAQSTREVCTTHDVVAADTPDVSQPLHLFRNGHGRRRHARIGWGLLTL